MIKETVIAVSVITMAAGAALAPTAASAGEQPLVVADIARRVQPLQPVRRVQPLQPVRRVQPLCGR